jgi:microcin C transport system substrate-binding protein
VQGGKLVNAQGQPMSFEFLLPQGQAAFERIIAPFVQNLEKLGISARIRPVDVAQYQNRVDDFDFDMMLSTFGQSESPGNEQRDYWSSAKADQKASRNIIGIKDPVIDELIELVISAPDRDSLVQRVRALDRVLQWGHWVVPNWYSNVDRVAAWDKFGWPATTARAGFDWTSWWVDPQREAALRAKRGR